MADDATENQDGKATNQNSDAARIPVRKNSFNLVGTTLLVLFFVTIIAWLRFSTGPYKNDDDEDEPTVEQTETPPAAQKKVEDLRDSEVNDALDVFLVSNYKDWQKQGKSYDDAASDEDRLQIFDVQLINGNKNQIITVFVEKFQKDDDSEYWFAYQPDNRQLLESAVKTAAKKSSADDSFDKSNSDKK